MPLPTIRFPHHPPLASPVSASSRRDEAGPRFTLLERIIAGCPLCRWPRYVEANLRFVARQKLVCRNVDVLAGCGLRVTQSFGIGPTKGKDIAPAVQPSRTKPGPRQWPPQSAAPRRRPGRPSGGSRLKHVAGPPHPPPPPPPPPRAAPPDYICWTWPALLEKSVINMHERKIIHTGYTKYITKYVVLVSKFHYKCTPIQLTSH
jgi:hypothetical protein